MDVFYGRLLDYLRAGEHLEALCPRRLGARVVGVGLDRLQSLLEQNQDAVHDAHDEMRRTSEFAHGCNVRRLDGVQCCLGIIQGWARYL